MKSILTAPRFMLVVFRRLEVVPPTVEILFTLQMRLIDRSVGIITADLCVFSSKPSKRWRCHQFQQWRVLNLCSSVLLLCL